MIPPDTSSKTSGKLQDKCNNKLGGYPYLQLRAELRRTWLQLFENACNGTSGSQPHQLIVTTEHRQISKVCYFFPKGEKPNGLENPCGTAENQRTTQLTNGPGRVSSQGHLGERRALYSQANHVTLR